MSAIAQEWEDARFVSWAHTMVNNEVCHRYVVEWNTGGCGGEVAWMEGRWMWFEYGVWRIS